MPTQINASEAALAVIGISAVIDDEVPRIGVERAKEIEKYGADIDDRAEALASGKAKQVKISRSHDYRKLLDRLSQHATPADLQKLTEKFPEDMSPMVGPFLIFVRNALEHLRAIFPTSSYTTFTGPKTMVPPDTAVFDFFNKLLVLNNPMLVFDLMGSGALLRSQAAVVRDFFPTLSARIDEAIYAAVAARKVAKESYQLPPRAALGVATWLGRRTVDHDPQPKPPVLPAVRRPTGRINRLAELQKTPAEQARP